MGAFWEACRLLTHLHMLQVQEGKTPLDVAQSKGHAAAASPLKADARVAAAIGHKSWLGGLLGGKR